MSRTKKRRELDENITTVGNFSHATKDIPDSTQIYVQMTGPEYNDSVLIEVTEIQHVLPKMQGGDSYVILRCK